MSRTINDTLKQKLYDQETDEVIIELITIDHDDFTAPIRVSSNGEDVVSRGNTFVSYPFDLKLPTDETGSPPRATLSIDAVDRTIVNSIRKTTKAATIMLEVVAHSDLDNPIASIPDFQLKNITGDLFKISGELILENQVNEPFPYRRFVPSEFGGLF